MATVQLPVKELLKRFRNKLDLFENMSTEPKYLSPFAMTNICQSRRAVHEDSWLRSFLKRRRPSLGTRLTKSQSSSTASYAQVKS